MPSDFSPGSLISPTNTWSTNLLSTNRQMYELMLLGFPRHALLLILDDAFVWNFESECRFTANCHVQLFESAHTPCYFFLEYRVGVCNELHKFCLMQLAMAGFMNFLRGFLTQNVVFTVSFLWMLLRGCEPPTTENKIHHSMTHVLLVIVSPRSTNCDSLRELG